MTTTATYDEHAVHQWLTLLHANTPGLTHICSSDDWAGRTFTDLTAATRYTTYLNGQGREGIYARVTTLRTALPPGSRGGAADTAALPALWADVDIAGPGHKHDPTKYEGRVLPPDEASGRALVTLSGLPEPTLWIHTGGGLYPIWLFDEPYIMPDDDGRAAIVHLAAEWQKVMTVTSKRFGWHYGSGIGDLARVLRIPGTINRKAGLTRPCHVLEHTGPRWTVEQLRHALAAATAAATPPTPPAPPLTAATPAPTAIGPRSSADPGEDFNNRASWAQVLEPHGWREHYRQDAATHWTRPGKPAGTSATTNVLGTDRLHVFSTAAPPFEADESYHKFAAYTLLNHGGDYTAATRTLAQLGYGTPIDHGARQRDLLAGLLGTPTVPLPPTQTAAATQTATGGGPPSQYFVKGELLAQVLADAVLERGPLAAGGDDIIWAYRRGVWHADRYAVRDRTAHLLNDRYRRTYVTHVEDLIRARSARISCDPVSGLINFANGLLDWRTGEMTTHTPTVPTTVQMAVPWLPDATCPRFDAFLYEVVPPDMVTVVWELIGYLMYSGNPLHKAVMLMGAGRNGKGTLLRAIVALLGKRNVTAVSLHDLVSVRFTTASLFGKIANIAGDIDSAYLESTATFKAITGQDQISAEHKGRDRFDFTPWAVPVFSANEIPPASDTTVGYLSRWLLIPFPFSFVGREDRNLDAKLHSELPGIAAKAIPALRRLLARGEFERPPSAAAAYDEFARRVDQVRTWLGDCCEITPAPHDPAVHPLTPRAALYQAYRQWCARDGHRPLQATKFFDRLGGAGLTPATVRGCRGFRGIVVVDTAEPPRLLDAATQRVWGETDGVGGAAGGAAGVQLQTPPPAPLTGLLASTDAAGGAGGAAIPNPYGVGAGDVGYALGTGGVSDQLHPLHPPAPLINCGVCGRPLDPALAARWHALSTHPSCHHGATP